MSYQTHEGQEDDWIDEDHVAHDGTESHDPYDTDSEDSVDDAAEIVPEEEEPEPIGNDTGAGNAPETEITPTTVLTMAPQASIQLEGYLALERSRIAAQREADARLQAAVDKEHKLVRALPPPPDLPPRAAIESGLLLMPTATHELVARLAMEAPEPLEGNVILSLSDSNIIASLTGATGRLIVLVLREAGESTYEFAKYASVPDQVLRWFAENGSRAAVVRVRHAVWVHQQVHRRLGLHAPPPTEQALVEFERKTDIDLWRSAEGIATWLRWAHVEWLTADNCAKVLQARISERRQQIEADRRELNRRIRTTPALASPVEILRVNRGGVTWFIDGLIPDGGMSSWLGLHGQGKSKAACAVAVAAATGRAFCRRSVNHGEICKVLYLALERHVVASADLMANCRDDRERDLVAQNVTVSSFVPQLIGDEGRSLQRWCADLTNNGTRLVIVDTFTALCSRLGIDEVMGAGPLIDSFRLLVAHTGANVLFLPHARKGGDGDGRGSSLVEAVDNQVPVVLENTKPGEMVVRLVTSSKHAKHSCRARPTEDLLLTFRERDGGMALVDEREVPPSIVKTGATKKGAKATTEDRVLAVMTKDPMAIAAIMKAAGTSRSATYRAITELVINGKVRPVDRTNAEEDKSAWLLA